MNIIQFLSCFLQQAALREKKDNKKERADRAWIAQAEFEGAAAPASLILGRIISYTSVPAMGNTCVEILYHLQQAAARENKDNKEVKDRADRARAAKAEREGAAATAQAYKSALGLAAKPDWGAAKFKATPTGKGSSCLGPIKKAAATIPAVQDSLLISKALPSQHSAA